MVNKTDADMSVDTIEIPEIDGDGPAGQPFFRNNLDVIKDITVDLKVMIGETNISVEELFELKTGSVIELTKSVDEPVDVVLNGKVVAKGELVAAGENFGIRVTSINSQSG